MISTITPTKREIAINMSKIIRLFFRGLFVLKSTAKATPEFASNPQSIAPAEMIFPIYNSLMITLEAQLGIIPTITENKLASAGFVDIRDAILSSPIKWIAKFINSVKAKINAPTFKVCMIAGFMILL